MPGEALGAWSLGSRVSTRSFAQAGTEFRRKVQLREVGFRHLGFLEEAGTGASIDSAAR